MCEFYAIFEDVAQQSIAAAVAEGVRAHPDVAAAKVIDRLRRRSAPSCSRSSISSSRG